MRTKTKAPVKIVTLRRGYRDAQGVIQTGYEYSYGPGKEFTSAFIAALTGEFERLEGLGPLAAGWVEVEVRLYPSEPSDTQA